MRYLIGAIRLVLVWFLALYCYYGYRLSLLFVAHTEQRGFDLRRFFIVWTCRFLGVRIQKTGDYTGGPVLYIVNHKGMMDFVMALRFVDAYILAKQEMEHFPVIGSASKLTGIIFVKRENKESRGAARRTIYEALTEGKSVMVFPEGTTHGEKLTNDFFPGSFVEAARAGVPVIPVAVEYRSKRDYFIKRSVIATFFDAFGKLFTFCKVSFGPPIISDDPEVLLNSSKQWIDNTLIEMQDGWSRIQYEPTQH